MRIMGMWIGSFTCAFIWFFAMIFIYLWSYWVYQNDKMSVGNIIMAVMFATAFCTGMFVLVIQEENMNNYCTIWDCTIVFLFALGFFTEYIQPLITVISWSIAIMLLCHYIFSSFILMENENG